MKMGKSLLLGTAAGLVTIAGAQAADLPVKAKPVDSQNLQPVRRRVLLHPGHRHVHQDWRLGPCRIWLGQQRQLHLGLGERQRQQPHDQQQRLPRPWLHHGRCPQPDRIRHGARLHRGRSQRERARRRRCGANNSARTAPSFSGRALPSAVRSRSSISTATRRRRTGFRSGFRYG